MRADGEIASTRRPADKNKIAALLAAILELNPRKKIIYDPKKLVHHDPKMKRRVLVEIWVDKMRWVANEPTSTHQFAKQNGARCEQQGAVGYIVDGNMKTCLQDAQWLERVKSLCLCAPAACLRGRGEPCLRVRFRGAEAKSQSSG